MKLSLRIAGTTIALCVAHIFSFAQTEIVNLSTGVMAWYNSYTSYTPSLLPTLNVDDTWMVTWNGLGGWVPAYVGTGSYQTTNSINPYACQIPQAKWISPSVTAAGDFYPMASPVGNVIYRTEISLHHEPCDTLLAADLEFYTINGDNFIHTVKINNTTYNVNPNVGFNACTNNYVINITNPNVVLQSGVNTIEIHCQNNEHVTGILMDAELKVYGSGNSIPMSPSFSFTSAAPFCQGVNGSVDGSASSGPIVKYMWTIKECDQFGNIVPAGVGWGGNWTNGSNPGVVNFANVMAVCNKYYKIFLDVMDACGNVSSASPSTPIYLGCTPIIDAGGSTLEICNGGSPTFNIYSSCTGCNLNINDITNNASVYNGPVVQPITIPPINGATSYLISVYDNFSGCSSTIPWTITTYNAIPMNFSGSGSTVCPGSMFIWLVLDASGYWNYNNCVATVTELSTNTQVWGPGLPLQTIMLTPSNVPETYVITITDTEMGCTSTYYWNVTYAPDCAIDPGPDKGGVSWSQTMPETDALATFYPVPSEGVLNVVTNGFGGHIDVHDALGHVVHRMAVGKGETQYVLDLSAQPKGVYMVKMTGQGRANWQRVVLQ